MISMIIVLLGFLFWPAMAVANPVVLIGWDGADWRVVREMLAAGELPNAGRLASLGKLTVDGVTQTAPQWETQLTGMRWYEHGTIWNGSQRAAPLGRTIFEVLASRGISSAIVTGKPGNIPLVPGSIYENVPAVTIDAVSDASLTEQQIYDRCTADLAAGVMFLFCHFKHPDHEGHVYGGMSPEYRASLRLLDGHLGRFLNRGDLTILLVSDHGFELAPAPAWYIDPYFLPRIWPYGQQHLAEPRAIIGASVPLDLYRPSTLDVMRTALAMMGVPAPEWADGRSLLK